MLLLNILSDFSAQRDLIHHYSLPIFPFIFVWLIRSLGQYQQRRQRKWLTPRFLVLWAVIIFFALAKYGYFTSRYLSALSNINSVRTAVSLVPSQGSVLATTHIAPYLSHRQVIKVINKNSDIEQLSNYTFDYIILDLQHPGRGLSSKLMNNLVENYQKSPQLELSYQRDQVFFFLHHNRK